MLRILLNKKGWNVFFLIIELAIVVFVFYLMGELMRSAGTEEYFSNVVLAEDAALFVDALYAAPGNARMTYHNDLTNKDVEFSENKIWIDGVGADYVSAETELNANFRVENSFQIYKSGQQIYLEGNNDPFASILSPLNCPDVSSNAVISEVDILLDPFYSATNPGVRIRDSYAVQITSDIARSISILWPNRQRIGFTRSLDVDAIETEISDPSSQDDLNLDHRRGLARGKDLMIGLNLGRSASSSSESIIAYVFSGARNHEKAQKLSCIILNRLQQEFRLDNIRIRSLSSNDLFMRDDYRMLDAGTDVSVILEIGNIYSFGDEGLLSQPSRVGREIFRGIEEYYN